MNKIYEINYKNKEGFTLIELLVVIAIIGLLATLSIVALNSVKSRSRDARRVSDIKQMQTALELYFNNIGFYPPDSEVVSGNKFATQSVVYMGVVPTAPVPADNPRGASTCVTGGNNNYVYKQGLSGSSYHINFCLGQNIGNIGAGLCTATPSGIQGGGTVAPCAPSCDGKECGDNGCGGSCGVCSGGQTCNSGTCCTIRCEGKECGDDGCGGSCGKCNPEQTCNSGTCCTPYCGEQNRCGPDGCGGSCGTCRLEEECIPLGGDIWVCK